jgi:hypothetical protein
MTLRWIRLASKLPENIRPCSTWDHRISPGSLGIPRKPARMVSWHDLWRRAKLTFGYITEEVTSASVICLPNLLRKSALIFLKSRGSMVAPGRPSILGLFLIMCVRRGSGKPPTGCPRYPWKNSTTDVGKSSSWARLRTSFFDNLLEVIHCAKSPTTLDDGVTCPKLWMSSAKSCQEAYLDNPATLSESIWLRLLHIKKWTCEHTSSFASIYFCLITV